MTADSSDPFDLARFLSAHDDDGSYLRALSELRAGRKVSHWMWFVFPQLAGLGRSPMAQRYAISSLEEASRYLAHPVLGPRLHESTAAVLAAPARTAEVLLGGIDAQKLRSSMTLFLRADPQQPIFQQVLDRYFDGDADPATDRLL